MAYEDICEKAGKLVGKYGERDPFRLCRDMDIILLFQSLGSGDNAIKGFYLESSRIRTITVNADLSDALQRVVAAHELGHAVLHRTDKVRSFNELWLFNEASLLEKEANLFAAELLIDDGEALDILKEGSTFFEAAARLRVPMELLDFKLRLMRDKGYEIREAPVRAESGFLKGIS